MNAERRKKLEEISGKIEDLKALVEEIKDAEQEAHDNLPESLQDAEQGRKMDETIGSLESVEESLGSAISSIEEATIA